MDKLVVPTPSNGFPLNNDDIRFLLGLAPYSDGIYQALEGMLAAYGTDLIVSGCGVAGSNIAEGWVLIGGVLVKVDAHTATNNYFEIVTTYNANGQKQTQTGGLADAYQQNRATATAASGTLASPVSGNPETFPKSKILDLIRTDSDFESTTTNKGVSEKATNLESQNGTADKNITADLFQSTSALKATNTDAENGFLTSKWISPSVLAHMTGGIKRKIVTIGDWNMDTTTQISFAHGENIADIIGMSCIIRNDTDTARVSFVGDSVGTAALGWGSSMNVTATNIVLNRITGGLFDNTSYDSTSYNRGWVILDLLA